MEPILYSPQAVLRCVLILALSLSVFAQIPAAPDASGFSSGRKVPNFPLTAVPPALIPHPPFEFRGIRIGDEMKEAERKFLALKIPSLSSKPGLCGSEHASHHNMHERIGYRVVREHDVSELVVIPDS